MRAEIEIKKLKQTRKVGFFKAEDYYLYQMWPHVTFTQEEINICTQFNLWNRVAYTHTASIDHLTPAMQASLAGQSMEATCTIVEIAQPGFHLGVSDPVRAQQIASDFENEVLPNIKAFINQCSVPQGKRIVDL